MNYVRCIYSFTVLSIFVLKIILKVGGNLTKFWPNNFAFGEGRRDAYRRFRATVREQNFRSSAISNEHSTHHPSGSAVTGYYKKSPANAKGNAQQRCMFESPVRTKTKLTHPSNDVSFTLARERQTAGPVSLSRIGLNGKFFLPPFI